MPLIVEIKKLKKLLLLSIVALGLVAGFLITPVAYAQPTPDTNKAIIEAQADNKELCKDSAKCETVVVGDECKDSTEKGATKCLENQPFITDFLKPTVNILSALVGVVVVASIIFGGVQYAMAGEKPEQMGAAKKRITQSLVALLIYMLLFAFIQYLIPGGLFNK